MEERYPSFPKEEDKKTIENIIRQYPKTNDCELQTLGELRDWQIKELKKLMENNWISVKEKLPDEGKYVLLYFRNFFILGFLTKHEDGTISWSDENTFDYGRDVTHWMPLPERPKE